MTGVVANEDLLFTTRLAAKMPSVFGKTAIASTAAKKLASEDGLYES
jgi:hypothetical protein